MTLNVLSVSGELIGIVTGIVVLLVFGFTFSPLVRPPKVPSGAAAVKAEPTQKEAHEDKGQEKGGEHVRADGYIDSFAGLVEEAGGSFPLIVTIFSISLLIWWAATLLLEWSQVWISVRTLWR